MNKADLKDLIYRVNGAAITIHKSLGPGLLEKVYHHCMKQELTLKGINYISEGRIPVSYNDVPVDTRLYCDLLIENSLVVELKAVATLLPIHEAQILTYMKLLKVPMGLIINFNCQNIYKNGQKTYVNELYRQLS